MGGLVVRIHSKQDQRNYLGAIVKGPFAEPDGLRADAPIVVTATVRGKGGILLPRYHGRVQVELLGEELGDGTIVPPRRRPLPTSPVFPLSQEETANVLRTEGDIRLGIADSHEDIEVRIPAGRKSVFPRHLGVLGTTGGGKSTTVSGLIAQLQRAGAACVLIDTEGEYTAMDQPTDDRDMRGALARRGMEPAGVPNTRLYHLVGRDTANPEHPRKDPFRLDLAELSPYAIAEVLELSQAQDTRFMQAYDTCKQVLRDLRIYPANRDEETEAMELDELESGYPRLTLSHLLDIVGFFHAKVAKDGGDFDPFDDKFKQNRERIAERVNAVKTDSEVSWRALLARLWRLQRLRIFDNPRAQALDYAAMLQPGQVSIIDLSDTDSPQINNLVIAQLLRGIQRQQDAIYEEAERQGKPPLLTMVFIEEAHEFLSRERIGQMPVLFQQVARIARRGRKRWLGLAFVTQLPQHLPDEVLGLINNWVLHKMNDANVINRLRRSIGGIDEGLWSKMPTLAPGQAVVSFTSLTRPLLVAMDPTPSKLQMME